MRIISGKFRSRPLKALKGMAVRPTLDQTKEAIFSSIGGRLDDLVVLDVFGGSGALALESISRGAKFAYIIDKAIDSIKIIKENVESLGVQSQVKIIKGDYRTVLPTLKDLTFDVIFLDPPYAMKIIDELVSFFITNKMINPGGVIICEYAKGDLVNTNYEELEVKLHRNYSNSEVLILKRKE